MGVGKVVTVTCTYDHRVIQGAESGAFLGLIGRLLAGEGERGVLVCGTGIGMAIVANKVPGVRAAQAHDLYSAERARKSNDAQIITLGALVVGPELAKALIDVWLRSEFGGGRSAPKVAKINAVDERYRRHES